MGLKRFVTVNTAGVLHTGPASAVDIMLSELNPFVKSTMNARTDNALANGFMSPPTSSLPQETWAIKETLERRIQFSGKNG
jgi:hypothetical protein